MDAAKDYTEIRGEHQYQCPRRPLLDHPGWYGRIFEAHGDYTKGFLPDAGPPSSQGNRLMRLIHLVDAIIGECDGVKNAKGPPKPPPPPRGAGVPRPRNR